MLGLATIAPMILYAIVGRPVSLLKFAASIEAVHLPVVAGLTLYANYRLLPRELRPSWPMLIGTVLASLFFLAFAAFYLLEQAGLFTGRAQSGG